MTSPALTRPQAVLFDWDNTLVDTWGVIHDALTSTFEEMNHPGWDLAQTKQRVRRSLRETFPEIFGEEWERARDIFYARYEAIHLIKLDVLPGAAELIETLDDQGIYLGVVSNKSGDNLRREASHLGWDRFFKSLIGATDAVRDKPATDPVVMALGPGGFTPGPHVWFVGDTPVDMECAHNAGCIPVLIREETAELGEFDNHPPRHHFSDCLKLAALASGLQ